MDSTWDSYPVDEEYDLEESLLSPLPKHTEIGMRHILNLCKHERHFGTGALDSFLSGPDLERRIVLIEKEALTNQWLRSELKNIFLFDQTEWSDEQKIRIERAAGLRDRSFFSMRKCFQKYLIYGLLIPCVTFLVPAFVAGTRFSGHCDNGDGVWCTGSGVDGFLEYLFGGYMGPGVPLGLGITFVFFVLWGFIVTALAYKSLELRISVIAFHLPLFAPLLWKSFGFSEIDM